MKGTYVILEKKFKKSNNLKETNRLNLLTVLKEILPVRLNKLIITNLKPPFKQALKNNSTDPTSIYLFKVNSGTPE